MATFRLRRFASTHILRAIRPNRLQAFLHPYREYLSGRGLALPSGPLELSDFEALVRLFMSPDVDTPPELIDALFLVDEMSTEGGADELVQSATEARVPIAVGAEDTPADVAVEVWLRAPQILERRHAEQFLVRARSFEYFQADASDDRKFQVPGADHLGELERMLGGCFQARHRSGNCRVFAFDRGDEVWFMVRHGELFKREEALTSGPDPVSVAYRPIKYDVLVLDPQHGEIRMNAQTKWQKDAYLSEFGRVLFGDPEHFPNKTKYTLEPLRRDGAACVVCNDIEGLEWVRLREVHLSFGGPHGEYEIRKANDLFAAMTASGRSLPSGARLARAVFSVKYIDAKRPRVMSVRPPNVAQYERDEDSVRMEQWLARRGFLNVYGAGDDEADDPLLVGP